MPTVHSKTATLSAWAAIACAGTLSISSQAHADVAAVTRSTQGWYSERGTHSASNLNSFTGEDTNTLFGTAPQGVYRFNSFFTFDVSSLGGAATSAGINFYLSNIYIASPSLGFTVFDVSTSLGNLTADHLTGDSMGQAIYNDLGSGQSYGTFELHDLDVQQRFHVLLSPAGISNLNASYGGAFVVGVSLTGGYQIPGGPEGANFGDESYEPHAELIVGTNGSDITGLLANPVPAPASLGMALGQFALYRGRRRADAALQ